MREKKNPPTGNKHSAKMTRLPKNYKYRWFKTHAPMPKRRTKIWSN